MPTAEQPTLDGLTRSQRRELRRVLVASVASGEPSGLADLVRRAPMSAVPAAAALHRLSGSVHRGLSGVEGVPDPVLDRLAAARQRSSFHHLLVTGTVDRIGAEFDRAGVEWVVIKGPVAASLLYPEPADRSYGDLDLLVGRRDFGTAMRILEDLAFENTMRNWSLAERMLAGQVTMSSPTVDVDLHWHVHYSRSDRQPFAIDPEAMIARRRRVTISGAEVPTLDPVDTLLLLAFHAARSDGHRLIWLKDLERSLAVEEPDLDDLVRRADHQRCGPPVGIMLRRARSVLGAEVSESVLRELVPGTLRVTEGIVTSLVPPVRFDERSTITRLFTRSVRSSTWTTIASVPARLVRTMHRRRRVPTNETNDPVEKSRYLEAVALSANDRPIP